MSRRAIFVACVVGPAAALLAPGRVRPRGLVAPRAAEGSVARCEAKIAAALAPESLTVDNSEDDPNGTHVAIACVSDRFEGLSRVKRQQLVMRSIRDELDSGAIHAIDSLRTQTPAEAAAG
mmetsp:Transcript_12014/g.37015  ORF Transcript_12014/g.37015 Transcript_12014/m.37015 type:complete len:121 (+) Transcript_12014:1706-2068(+)